MLLTEKEARTICEKLLSYVKADDASVSVNSENYGHLRFASNAFTTSGKSKNILRALEAAKQAGIESICFSGRDGGFTRGVATLDLIVPGNVTARIQEAHKLLFHVLCETVERDLPRQ